MTKIKTSLGCPQCNSSNVTHEILYSDVETQRGMYYEDEYPFIKITRRKNYDCKCHNCGKTYMVDHGIESYTRFEEPCRWDQCDVSLLAIYESESERSYKIVLVQGIYMIFCDDDEYPVIIQNEQVEEFVADNQLTKKYLFNTMMNRHR